MGSVMMPQEGPLLNDENAEPSLMSVNTNKPPWKTPNIRKRIKTGCRSMQNAFSFYCFKLPYHNQLSC